MGVGEGRGCGEDDLPTPQRTLRGACQKRWSPFADEMAPALGQLPPQKYRGGVLEIISPTSFFCDKTCVSRGGECLGRASHDRRGLGDDAAAPGARGSDGTVLAEHSADAGILTVPDRAFASVLKQALDALGAPSGLPVMLSGMSQPAGLAGARLSRLPADAAALARSLDRWRSRPRAAAFSSPASPAPPRAAFPT